MVGNGKAKLQHWTQTGKIKVSKMHRNSYSPIETRKISTGEIFATFMENYLG